MWGVRRHSDATMIGNHRIGSPRLIGTPSDFISSIRGVYIMTRILNSAVTTKLSVQGTACAADSVLGCQFLHELPAFF